jgi:Ca2+-binding RTX toxin-like protein/V8-like Glu-specific endopeptidase
MTFNTPHYSIVNTAISNVIEILNGFAADPLFGEEFILTFGTTVSAKMFKKALATLPEIEVLSDDKLEGALGAFSAQTGKIYLSESLVNGDRVKLQAVLFEEIGHYLDSVVNARDTAGDEGELFSALVREVKLEQSELPHTNDNNHFVETLLSGSLGDPNPSLDGVFGTDDRVAITGETNLTSYPRRTVGFVTARYGDQWFGSSGVMIGPYHFLTAAHGIFNSGRGGFADEIAVYMGVDGQNKYYGKARVTQFHTVNGYTGDNDGDGIIADQDPDENEHDYDWAVLTLDRSIGDFTGWMGWKYYGDLNSYNGLSVNSTGYPRQTINSDGTIRENWPGSFANTTEFSAQMYNSSGLLDSATDRQIRHRIDISGGNSGGPIWIDDGGIPRVIGVTTAVMSENGTPVRNEALRLQKYITDFIETWKANDTRPSDKPDFADHDDWFRFNSSSFRNNSTSSSVNDASNSLINVNVGDSITFNARIRNNGTARVDGGLYLVEPTINVSFYASSNTTISGNDYKIGEANISAINPFSQSYATLNTSFPNIPEGNYSVGYTFGSIMSEFNTNDNTGIIGGSTITVKHKRDLSGDFFDAKPEPLKAGDSFSVDFRVKNTEVGFINGFWVDFYLSTNSTISTSDKFLGNYWVSNLSGNATTTTLNKTLSLPSLSDSFWNSTLGNYYIGMIIDSTSLVTESNESNNNSTGSLLDYDDVIISAKPTITIVATDANAAETVSGSTLNTGIFTLTRTGNTNNPLTVFYSLFGTASNGSDYSQISQFGTTFAAGSSTTTIVITPIDDTNVEPIEMVNISLSGDSNYILGGNTTATVNIADNDIPTINLSANQTVVEGLTSLQSLAYTVSLSVAGAQTITVNYATANGTALADSDYTNTLGTLTFSPGQTTQTISIPILNDSLDEGNETFTLTLSSPTNGTLGTATATTTITDTLSTAVTTTLPPNVENLLLTGTTAINGTGNAGNNKIWGNTANNILWGGAGNDILQGGDSIDRVYENGNFNYTLSNVRLIGNGTDTLNSIEAATLVAGAGNNTMDARTFTGSTLFLGLGGNDFILGGSGVDDLRGGEGNDRIYGYNGNDVLRGENGNDFLWGGAGNDILQGGDGIDRVYENGNFNYTLSNVRLIGNGTDALNSIEAATLVAGAGNNTMDARTFTGSTLFLGLGGNDFILGGSGVDDLRGGEGDDRIYGYNGNDVLRGENGNDFLWGGAGKDTLTGGGGTDKFVLTALSDSLLATYDVITDYTTGELIDAASNVIAKTLTASSGNATSLTAAAISAVLTSGVFAANSAQAFTVTGQSGTFLAFNDAKAGFNPLTDSIVQLQGHTLGSVSIV